MAGVLVVAVIVMAGGAAMMLVVIRPGLQESQRNDGEGGRGQEFPPDRRVEKQD